MNVTMTATSRQGRRQARRFWTIGLMLLLFTTGLLPRPTAAQAAWSEPVKVSGETLGAWFPDVAADQDGRIHIVWNAAFRGDDRYPLGGLFYTRGDGQRWSAPTDIALIWRGHALRSAIAVDPAGRLNLTYKGLGALDPAVLVKPGSLGPEDIWHMRVEGDQAQVMNAWTAPVRLTAGSQGYFSDLAVDSQGVLHTIFTESEGGNWVLFYRRSADGGVTWTPRQALEPHLFVWWYRAALRIDSRDRVHVVWETTDAASLGVTRGFAYALSNDQGKSWSTTHFLSQTPDISATGQSTALPGFQQPAVGVDGDGQILLVSREPKSSRLHYQLSRDGKIWSLPEPLPGIATGIYRPYDTFDMVTDSAGRVHLAVVAYPQGSTSPSLLHLVWNGRQWSAPTVIVAAPPVPEYAAATDTTANPTTAKPLISTPYPEYPRLAISQGNRLHLVWFGGDRLAVDREPIGVFYSTIEVDAPVERPARPVIGSPLRTRGAVAAPPSAIKPAITQLPATVRPASADSIGSMDYARWQAFPIVIGTIVLVPLLLVAVWRRLRPFER